MKNILDILFEYSKQNKLFDEYAINEIYNYLQKECEFNENLYINIDDKKHLVKTNRITLAYYQTDYINVYLSNIYKSIIFKHYKFDYIREDKLSNFEIILRKNLYILEVLMHEFEHFIQESIYYSDLDDFESKIIKIEESFIKETERAKYYGPLNEAKHRIKIYKLNYKISIIERLADINSISKINNLLKEVKGEYEELYKIQENILLEYKIRNYLDFNDSPTMRFLKNIDKLDCFDYDVSLLSEEDRLKYGFEISEETFNKNFEKFLLEKK